MTAQTIRKKMTAPEFILWSMAQPRGRYELVDGEIVAMAPERTRHNLAKLAVARAFQDAVKKAGLPCTVFTDGMTVVIDEHHAREPDAAVQCGVALDLDATVLEAPLIVVEVTSPSSARDDTDAKLVEYFSVPSIRHYLIVAPAKKAAIHHARDEHGVIGTNIARDGEIAFDPPGFRIAVRDLFVSE